MSTRNILHYVIYSRFSDLKHSGKKRVVETATAVRICGGPNDAWGKSYGIRKWLPILAAHQALHYVIYVCSHPAMTRVYQEP